MPAKLTATSVEKLRPLAPGQRRAVPDGVVPGLQLRVNGDGSKSWRLLYRTKHGDRKCSLGLGSYPAVDLVAARGSARDALEAVAHGDDPAGNKAAKRAARRLAKETGLPATGSVAWGVALFDAEHVVERLSPRTQLEARRALRALVEMFGERELVSINRADARTLIGRAKAKNGSIASNRILAYCRAFFSWCVRADLVQANPFSLLSKVREVARERVLTDSELVEVWRATEALGWPFAPIYRLLVMTGARRDEIGRLTWSEVALDGERPAIALAGERTKNGKPHVIPLSPQSVEILQALPRFTTERGVPPYVFTKTGKTPVSGWSNPKERLDAAILKARRDAAVAAGADPEQVEPIPEFRVHDFRRTLATGLQRFGARLEVIESILGHVSGSRAGIVGIYQRHSFEPEARIALDRWGEHVAALAAGRAPAGNVVALRAAGASP